VVPLEIGVRPEAEIAAVKAQAVAARTYAVGNMGGRPAQGFDFYATVADQVYGGLDREDPLTSRAVAETRGQVLTYDGEPIVAYYHSTCGGRTSALEDVWPWRDGARPYLRSVSDERPGGGAYCDGSNRYRWTVSWTGDRLAEILGGVFETNVSRVRDVEIRGRTESGRVERLAVTFDGRTVTVPGDSLRWVLRPEPGRILNSALLFELHEAHEDGALSELTVEGGGWGHGVGMCQWGAIGRARAGQDYPEILTTYYPGTRLRKLY
jgi:stage II sporulation protein D